MHFAYFVHHLLDAGARSGLLPVAIVLATLIFEDVSVVFVGVLTAAHHVSIPTAVAAVIIGLLITDFGFYSIGRLGRTNSTIRRWVEHERVAPLKEWIHNQLFATVLSARFLPGFRWPTFLACGFFGVPLEQFAPRATGAILIWTTIVFPIAYFFGYFSSGVLGFWRWPIAFVVIGVAIFFGHRHLKKLQELPATSSTPRQ